MGNTLRATKDRLTLEQFKEYLNLLKGITYKLLLKRHIDVAIEMHEKIHKEDIDYLEGTTAGDVLAKVRFKNTKEILWQYEGTMPSASEYKSDIVFSDEIMDSNPRYWSIGLLLAGMEELEKCRMEFFGDESTTEPPKTSAAKRAATVQATLAVFKSVFSQLPSEQPPPAGPPAAQPLPKPPLPPECLRGRRTKKKIPQDMSDILARIRASSFAQVADEILREKKEQREKEENQSTGNTLAKPSPQTSSTDSKTEAENTKEPVKSSPKSLNEDINTSTETKLHSSNNKNKTENYNSSEEKIETIEPSSLSNPSLDELAAENSIDDPIAENSPLDIPIVTEEPKTSLTFSDSLSDAFSPNQVSVLQIPGTVPEDFSDPNSPTLEDIKKHIFIPNFDTSENELFKGNLDKQYNTVEPSEPDGTEPHLD